MLRYVGFRALAEDERGLSTVEYVVLLVLLVAMAVGGWSAFGGSVEGKFGTASESFNSSVKAGTVPSDPVPPNDEHCAPPHPRTLPDPY